MSKSQRLKNVLDQAKGKEKKYNWIEAAELYEQAEGVVGKRDFVRKGEIQGKICYCFYRAAFQAETQEEFKISIQRAVEAYEKASKIHIKGEHAKGLYYKAMALYSNSWIQLVASRKKEVLDDCARLLKEAMKAFETAGDRLGYGRACNDLLFCLWDRRFLEWDWPENRRVLEEAIKHCQDAISTLSKIGDKRELARAYSIAGLYFWGAVDSLGEEKSEELTQTALTYAEKALELSKRTGEASLIAWSNWLAAWTQTDLAGNQESALRHSEEFLKQAKKTRDNFLIGYASLAVATMVVSLTVPEENPDKKREGYERTKQYAEDAVHHLRIVCRYDWLAEAYSYHCFSFNLAHKLETDLKERRNLLERAIEVGQEGLKYAEQSGSPQIALVYNCLSWTLYSLARMETQIAEKRRLLERASEHRQKTIDIGKQAHSPSNYWDHGVPQSHVALMKAEMATIETDDETKRNLLEEAVSHMERCVELCTKYLTIFAPQDMILLAILGVYYGWFSDILDRLYSLTREKETLVRATEICESAADIYRRAELPSRVAEAYWRAARLYDQLGEYTKAEHSFQSAEENYRLAAEKIPQLKELYKDHALYMQAWSEIEKARHHHAQRQYGQAKEHYKRAADLHKSTVEWNHLSPNYLAWANLEEAEDLSRREQGEEATEAFENAADSFRKAKASIKTELEKIQDVNAKKMATELMKASDLRHEYCQGRIVIEEARILDRQGNHTASSKKYGVAVKTFQEMARAESEQGRKELKPIVYLCQAWQKMMMAEAKASSAIYGEAAELFKKAKEHTIDQPTSFLALANSFFCKALEAGTEFEVTRDMMVYSAAKKHMEAAKNFYLKAGFKISSEYAKATFRLFDAYLFTYKAQIETDPEKKAQFYQMAEKLLQASAGSYKKAKHPEKSEEVQRLHENVKEERQLATSLAEVLHAPLIASTTASFSSLSPIYEKAVGLERFEHAHVQAKLFVQFSEVKVGENVALEIELVNAGKGSATLVKVEDIVPAGFSVMEKPQMYRLEDSYLNMRGKMLNPLKTEDVKIVVKPRSKGTFSIKPRVLYLDETGTYKSHEPEPVTITVKELGIKGWIKGER